MEMFPILRKHINVSHETLEKLVIYFDLLNIWQKKIIFLEVKSIIYLVKILRLKKIVFY